MLSIGAKYVPSGVQVSIFMNDIPVFGIISDTAKQAIDELQAFFSIKKIKKLPVRPSMDIAKIEIGQHLEQVLGEKYTREQFMKDMEHHYGDAGVYAAETCSITNADILLGFDHCLALCLPALEEELIANGKLNN